MERLKLSEGHPDEAERMESVDESLRRCEDAEDPSWFPGLPEKGPNPNDAPRQIPRLHVSDLTPTEFYERFISRGLPVVLEGLDQDDEQGWQRRLEALQQVYLVGMATLVCLRPKQY